MTRISYKAGKMSLHPAAQRVRDSNVFDKVIISLIISSNLEKNS